MATGNVQSVTGQTGTFGQGLSLGYQYQQGPDNYVDEIDANGGTLYLRDQSGVGRAISYAQSSYRTIFSAVVHGALGQANRAKLARGYMNYLLLGLGVEEGIPGIQAPRVAVTRNPARDRVSFAVGKDVSRLSVLDASGRTLAECDIAGGAASWDGRNVPAGTYFVRAAGSGETVLFVLLH